MIFVRAGALAHRWTQVALLCLFVLGCAEGRPPSADPFDVRITVSDHGEGVDVNPLLLGNNLQWVDRGDELLLPGGRWNRALLEKVERIHPTMLRYPGGTMADSFHWKKSVGPDRTREPIERAIGGRSEGPTFGVDEFLDLCERFKAQPLITINILKGSSQEAADWVRHVNIERPKSKPGSPKCVYWEIGNEPYLKPDKHPEMALTPDEYVRRADACIKAMRAVDAEIKVLIPLRSDKIGGVYATPWQGFNDRVLRGLKERFDLVALHNAYMPFPMNGVPKEAALYEGLISGSETVAADIKATRTSLEGHRLGARVGIAITEYNALVSIGQKTDGLLASPAAALFIADSLRVFADQQVDLAAFWSLTGNWYFGAIANDGQIRPAYRVLEGFQAFWKGKRRKLDIEGPVLATRAVGFSAAQPKLSLVTGLATSDDQQLRLWLVNKSRERVAHVNAGVEGSRRFSSIKAWSWSSPAPLSHAKNDAPEWTPIEARLEPPSLRFSLPPCSITRIEAQWIGT